MNVMLLTLITRYIMCNINCDDMSDEFFHQLSTKYIKNVTNQNLFKYFKNIIKKVKKMI